MRKLGWKRLQKETARAWELLRVAAPDAVVAKLTAAYAEGAKNADFVELMDNRGFTMMGLSGADAEAFLAKWQQGTTWLLQDAGLTKASPEEFGIARPGK